MTADEKKAYLNSYIPAIMAIKRYSDCLEELRKERDEGRKYPGCSEVEKLEQRLSEFIEIINRNVEDKKLLANDVIRRIEMMPECPGRDVLRLRYIQGLAWKDVSIGMGYSLKQINRIHNGAIDIFKCNDNETVINEHSITFKDR